MLIRVLPWDGLDYSSCLVIILANAWNILRVWFDFYIYLSKEFILEIGKKSFKLFSK